MNRKSSKLKIVLLIILGVLLLGLIVMQLWNAILPTVLGVGMLTYPQAVGILILCRILFGKFSPPNGRGPRGGRGSKMREKILNMTDEERNSFREKWKQSRK